MAPSRPDIPKKLAARVRGAQVRVTDLRDSLIHNHKRRLQAQAELNVFHCDPEAYAADRYGNHGVDSYPVQTRTSRLADNVGYRSSRISEIERDLPDAEAALVAVEADVLAEVLGMRPSTGRVPWPKPLPSFTGRIARGLEAQQRDIDAAPARVAAYRARLKAEYDSEMAELDRQTQREDEAEQRRFASLSPAQQEAERAEIRTFLKVVEERGLSAGDLFKGFGVSDTLYEVDREVRSRIARGGSES
jgi:hypothetical protein